MCTKIIFTICLLSFTCVFAQESERNLKTEALKGKVKKVIEYEYKFDAESNGFIALIESEKKFNDLGQLLSETSIDYPSVQPTSSFGTQSEMEKLFTKTDVYQYNKGLRKEISRSFPPQQFTDHFTSFEYNSTGKLVHKKKVFQNILGNTMSQNEVYTYDSEGRTLSHTSFLDEEKKGNLLLKEEFRYAGGQKTVTITAYNFGDTEAKKTTTAVYKNGVLASEKSVRKNGETATTTYTYDGTQLLSKKTITSKGKSYGFENKYNGKRLIQKKQTYPDGSYHVTTFDLHENELNYTSYNENKVENSKTKHVYEYDASGNWVKKYYKGTENVYFTVREIHYQNENKTGDLSFNQAFITRQGDVDAAKKVFVKKPESDVKSANWSSKTWNYKLLKENFRSTKAPAGTVALKVKGGRSLSCGEQVEVKIEIPVQPSKVLSFEGEVIDYHNSEEDKFHIWSVRPDQHSDAILIQLKISYDSSQSSEIVVQLAGSLLEFILE